MKETNADRWIEIQCQNKIEFHKLGLKSIVGFRCTLKRLLLCG